MIRSFTQWLSEQEGQETVSVFDAREGIKNLMANMRSDPTKWLGNLHWYMQRLGTDPVSMEAKRIISDMQNVAMRFFQEIREMGIYDNRQGNITRPRMPNPGEHGNDSYQKVYEMYYTRLHQIWQRLDALC